MEKIAGVPVILDHVPKDGEVYFVGIIKKAGKPPKMSAVKITNVK